MPQRMISVLMGEALARKMHEILSEHIEGWD